MTLKAKHISRADIHVEAVFGHLVADLENHIGSIGINPDSAFYELSPIAQADLIEDWIGLLNDLQEWLEHKAKGTIQ